MNDLQKIEFDLLKHFIKVCETYKLNYYLVCGSALGAVKYQGFIPWDDDIDVALPREDYEFFLKKAPEILPEYIFVQNYKTDTKFPQIFTKLRNSNTTYIEKTCENLDMNQGIYIDVFPLDGYPKNRMKARILEVRKYMYKHMLSTAYTEPKAWKSKMLYRIKRYMGFQNYTNKIAARYEKILMNYSEKTSEIWCNHGNWQGKLEYAKRSQYGAGIEIEFEGIKARVPEKYHAYLLQKYGDYKKDLPEEEKKGHHYYSICDCNRSYLEYR